MHYQIINQMIRKIAKSISFYWVRVAASDILSVKKVLINL